MSCEVEAAVPTQGRCYKYPLIGIWNRKERHLTLVCCNMELNICAPVMIFNINWSNESVYGRNIETVTPCYWLFGGFRNRKIDTSRLYLCIQIFSHPTGSINGFYDRNMLVDFLEVLQKQVVRSKPPSKFDSPNRMRLTTSRAEQKMGHNLHDLTNTGDQKRTGQVESIDTSDYRV